jgi:magnesium chelatase family protein
MNYAIAFGAYLIGLSVRVVCVKATATPGSEFTIDNGKPLARGEVDRWKETRIRVRGALASLGIDTGFSISFDHPPERSSSLDLAIFAACLGAIGRLPSDWFVNVNHSGAKLFFGELGLRGEVRMTRGVLAMLWDHEKSAAAYEKRHGMSSPVDDERQFVVPYDNDEASIANTGTNVYALKHVSELFDLPAHTVAHRHEYKPIEVRRYAGDTDKLPERVVRAIEIAAIGGHRIAFIGSLSCRAARLLCDLLPAMNREEAIELVSLHSIAGLIPKDPDMIGMRPFRAPHHTVSPVGLCGGGDPIRPGEVSLAHNGVLYLDCVPEFKRGAIEHLATFLREGRAIINRAKTKATFPAKPLLVTGCPLRCPCEFRNGKHSDFCTDERRKEWQSRHLETLGIEMIVDTDFADDDRPCTEDIETLRRWVACTIEAGRWADPLATPEYPHVKLTRTIANREGRAFILVKDLEKAAALSAR